MKAAYYLFGGFFVILVAISITHAEVIGLTSDVPSGVTCASERVAAYGYTDKRGPIAELAAIARWQEEAEKKQPGSSNWHLAKKRSMKCQTFKDSSHIQCVVSANPCRYDAPNTG